MARSPIWTVIFDGSSGRIETGLAIPPSRSIRLHHDLEVPIVGSLAGHRAKELLIDPGTDGQPRLIAGDSDLPSGSPPATPYRLIYLVLDSPKDGFHHGWAVEPWQSICHMDEESDGVFAIVGDCGALVAIPDDFEGGYLPAADSSEVGFTWGGQQYWLRFGPDLCLDSFPEGEDDPRRPKVISTLTEAKKKKK